MNLAEKAAMAEEICHKAGEMALEYFRQSTGLVIDRKGHQDWVSEADRNVEVMIRELLDAAWPEDGIVGEEHAPKDSRSGFTWDIDPIDGTTNLVNTIPAWTIVLAGVQDGKCVIGVIYDPNAGETYLATRGGGATLNGAPMRVSDAAMEDGTVSVGYSNRVRAESIVPVIEAVISQGAMFHRNASGALSLAYVSAGRLLGYVEEHMNAWDCLAGQLLIEEAGGRVEDQDADAMIAKGGRVVAGSTVVFDKLQAIADRAWG